MNAYAHASVNAAKDMLRSAILELDIAMVGCTRTPSEAPRLQNVQTAMEWVAEANRKLENALRLESMTEKHEHG